MNNFYYNISRHYDILNISDIIKISYDEQCEKTHDEYKAYLETHNCKLVGDINGFL